MTTGTIPITGDPAADRLLVENPLALLIGMLLDQQVPMGWAFRGPFTLQERLGGSLDAETIAALGPDKVEAIFRDKPAMHRYPGSMGKRTYELCAYIVEHYGGDAGAIWRAAPSGQEIYRRLRELPGYGDEKSKIFLAILGKRLGQAAPGWEEAAAPFSDATPRSVADVGSAESLAQVREFKKARKAQKRGKAD
ncbi:MAG TPA: HhH-GPD-type base excision DNA repair protein [Acidimicrobiia bacterium]|nr:HhH-GPD-type base excision DNA repair protein [Acidimicrobiia bacterium]